MALFVVVLMDVQRMIEIEMFQDSRSSHDVVLHYKNRFISLFISIV